MARSRRRSGALTAGGAAARAVAPAEAGWRRSVRRRRRVGVVLAVAAVAGVAVAVAASLQVAGRRERAADAVARSSATTSAVPAPVSVLGASADRSGRSPASTAGASSTLAAATSTTPAPRVTSIGAASVPAASVAVTSVPGASVAVTSVPGTSVPGTSVPGTTVPVTTIPVTSIRVTTVPVTSVPPRATGLPAVVTTRVFGPDAVVLADAPDDVRPQLSRAAARRRALTEVDASIERGDLEVVFGLYEDPGTLTEVGGTVVPQRRPVWVATFRGVPRRRASNIPERRRATGTVPPTTIRELRTDVVVVIDDRSGRVLLRSEYASDLSSGPPR